MKTLIETAIRQQSIFIPNTAFNQQPTLMHTAKVSTFIIELSKFGFGVNPNLLEALRKCNQNQLDKILTSFSDLMAVNHNWTPLIKDWHNPLTITVWDYFITSMNQLYEKRGALMPCGHTIPPESFPIDRYNGCPYCGTPFAFRDYIYNNQGSKLKMLELWTEDDAQKYLNSLVTSKIPLDAGKIGDLKALLREFPLPATGITMKETIVAVADCLIELNMEDRAAKLFKSPADIFRFLWYKKTGNLQMAKISTILRQRRIVNHGSLRLHREQFKLKYNRQECHRIAKWLNELPMSVQAMCETMHPQREMWVRMIRALRLAEYSKRKGFERLSNLMDAFYNGNYTVWQGEVNTLKKEYDIEATITRLQQRPGLFARSLFSTMLWFGASRVIEPFSQIACKVPARLLLTLQMYAPYYFDKKVVRSVKPLGGITKDIPAHPLLTLYEEEHLQEMTQAVMQMCKDEMKRRYKDLPPAGKSIFIDPALYNMPFPIGDRSSNNSKINPVEAGTRFKVMGDKIIIFMHWGEGLSAQHLDMDLSCVTLSENHISVCNYSQLQIPGCHHSGDIIQIPEKVGTAEYIEIDVLKLREMNTEYVVFACNAFSAGDLHSTVKVGWMDSSNPIVIDKNGVAYDPSCVQQLVQITQSLQKGLVFGILDLQNNEIIWAEVPFNGQTVYTLAFSRVRSLVNKLKYKLTIGELLELKAAAQQLSITATETADEVYTLNWGRNSAAVSVLLTD